MASKQQINHATNLLPAATTNLNISTMDVDSLLTPLTRNLSPRAANDWQRYEQRPERNLWRLEEIMEMLNTMQELHALELLNDKTVKSDTVFREVELEMNKKGYCKKSHVQIWTKWKFLKSTYTTSKRNGIKPKMIAPQIYDMLHKMLTLNNATLMSRSQSSSFRGDLSENGNSLASNNEDSDNSIRMPTSVENKPKITQKTNRVESDDENGLAHPIFGFRLGVVKQEPIDTGYESIIGDLNEPEEVRSATSNLRFRSNFKHESPPANLHSKFIPNTTATVTIPYSAISTTTTSPLSHSSTSTPIGATQPITILPSSSTPQQKNNMPMLRIAPFAKEPALVQNQGPNELRIANVRASADINTSSQKSSFRSENSINTRYSQESTPPVRSQTNTSSTQLRLKHTPLRRTPMPQEPDHIMPDEMRDLIDPDFQPYKYNNSSSSSIKAKKRSMELSKKRKVDSLDNGWSKKRKETTNDAHDYYDDDDNTTDDYLFNSSSVQTESTNTTKMEALFGNLLKAFQRSLYNMQHEMMNQFVINQMQLVRKEHEFQMRQDMQMMQTMRKQSEEFWQKAREFMSNNNNNNNNNNNSSSGNNNRKKKVNSVDQACQTEEKEEAEEEVAQTSTKSRVDVLNDSKLKMNSKEMSVQTDFQTDHTNTKEQSNVEQQQQQQQEQREEDEDLKELENVGKEDKNYAQMNKQRLLEVENEERPMKREKEILDTDEEDDSDTTSDSLDMFIPSTAKATNSCAQINEYNGINDMQMFNTKMFPCSTDMLKQKNIHTSI